MIYLGLILSFIAFGIYGMKTDAKTRNKFILVITCVFIVYYLYVAFNTFTVDGFKPLILNPQVTEFIMGMYAMIMFAKPISQLFKNKFTMGVVQTRKDSGIIATLLITNHAIYYFITYVILNPQLDFAIWLAIITMICMIILLVTSYNWGKKVIKAKNFKKVHRIAYVAFFIALLHAFNMTGKVEYLIVDLAYLFLRGATFLFYEKSNAAVYKITLISLVALASVFIVSAQRIYYKVTQTTNSLSNTYINDNINDSKKTHTLIKEVQTQVTQNVNNNPPASNTPPSNTVPTPHASVTPTAAP